MNVLAAGGEFPYTGLRAACHILNTGLLPFAFFMGVVGLVQAMSNGSQDIEHKMMSIVSFVIMIALMALWYPPSGVSIVQGLWEICSGPNSVSESLNAPTETEMDTGLAGFVAFEVAASVAKDKVENPRESGRQWSEYLQQLVGLGGIFFLQFAKILQNISLMVAGGLGPFFFGLMMFQQTRQTGITFILSTISVALWPVGWALARFGTQFLETTMATSLGVQAGAAAITGIIGNTNPFSVMTAVSWSAVISGWIVMTTIAVPAFLQSLVTYGVGSLGGQFLGSAQGGPLGKMLEGQPPSGGMGASSSGSGARSTPQPTIVSDGRIIR
jgi:hypothetical protein